MGSWRRARVKGIFHSLWMNGWSDGLSGDFFHFLIWCDLGRRNINCFFFFCFYVAIFLTVSFSLPRPTIPSPTCIFPPTPSSSALFSDNQESKFFVGMTFDPGSTPCFLPGALVNVDWRGRGSLQVLIAGRSLSISSTCSFKGFIGSCI